MTVVVASAFSASTEIRRTARPVTHRPAESVEQASKGMHDCAAAQRVIAVTSGKGGVGKSNIAANLATLLARSGVKVALIDADWGQGNLDVLLGVSAKSTVSEVLSGERTLWSVMAGLPDSLHLAAGSSGPITAKSSAAKALVDGGLMDVCRGHDVTILDCGSGIGRDVMDVCLLCGHVLVVTTPEPTAMTDAYGLIKCLNRDSYKGRVSILVNMTASHHEAKATYSRLSRVAAKFLGQTVFDAGYVPADEKVPMAVRRRRPFVQEFPAADATKCLAALMMKLRPKGSKLIEEGSWSRKLARLLRRNG